jgi:hypothetical protein
MSLLMFLLLTRKMPYYLQTQNLKMQKCLLSI